MSIKRYALKELMDMPHQPDGFLMFYSDHEAELARVTADRDSWRRVAEKLETQFKAAREALEEAARSLEAAAGAGRPESMMPDLETLRPWAKSRARLARAALAPKPEQEGGK